MRVILDTNILVAALISPSGPPAAILQAFLDERFTLVTCEPQLDELRRVTRDPKLIGLGGLREALAAKMGSDQARPPLFHSLAACMPLEKRL